MHDVEVMTAWLAALQQLDVAIAVAVIVMYDEIDPAHTSKRVRESSDYCMFDMENDEPRPDEPRPDEPRPEANSQEQTRAGAPDSAWWKMHVSFLLHRPIYFFWAPSTI